MADNNTPPAVGNEPKPEVESYKDYVDYLGEPKVVEKEFTYPSHTDPHRANDPHGVYLDDVERKKAEISRARMENRKPDLANPPAIQSTPLLPTEEVKRYVPSDHPVPVDETLPVVVGVAEENADFYGDAIKQREDKAE